MWIKPKESLGTKGNWVSQKTNTYFVLEKQKSLLSKSYRISIRAKKGLIVVATSENESHINEHWGYIEKNVFPHLSQDPEEFDDVTKYLELKFESLSKTEEDEVHSFFRQTFQLKDETVIEYFGCTIWKGLHRHGWIYITNNFLCFTSKMLRNNIVVPFKEITAMKKDGLVNKSIEISTKAKKYYFAAFFKRDAAFELIERLWKGAVDELLATAENTMSKLDIGMSASFELHAHNANPPEAPRRFLSFSGSGAPLRSLSRRRMSVADINIEKKNEEFRTSLRLPSEESIVGEFAVSMMDSADLTHIKGSLFVSQHFCSFLAKQENEIVQLVVPFLEVKRISKELVQKRDRTEAVLLHIDETSKFIFYPLSSAEDMYRTTLKMWNVVQSIAAKEETASLLSFLQTKTETPFYDQQSQLKKQQWDRYLSKYKQNGFCVLKELHSLKILLKTGMPEHLRPVLWPVCSGSLYKWIAQPGHYQELLKLYNNDESSISMADIDKDLHRSFPFHPFFQKKENLQILRRILVAYSWRNSAIGYTQSMNIVAAQLLLVMGEEPAFWMLSTICEDLVPEHYSKLLLGPIVDQQLLETLLKRELPDISQHFESIGMSLGILTYGWFMCLFVGFLSLEGSQRVLDMFCLEGKKVLFQVALAIFKTNRQFLLQERDPMKIVKELKANVMESPHQQLLKIAFEEYDHISMEDSSVLSYRFAAIATLNENNKSNAIYTLKNATHFSSDELAEIHRRFHALVSVHSTEPVLEKEAFEKILVEKVPTGLANHLKQHQEILDIIWKKTSIFETHVEFPQFVSFLSKICKESMEQRFDLFLQIFDQNGDSQITKQETFLLVQAMIAVYNKEESEQRIRSFVDMIFDQIQDSNEYSSPEFPRSSSVSSLGSSDGSHTDSGGAEYQTQHIQDEMTVTFAVMKRELVTNCKLAGMFRLETSVMPTLKRSPISPPAAEMTGRARSNTVC
eukprot:TRINITY_DN5053_c0_g1_i2.p1 TRINITY_DN5053_c0_g1~~TRINITY_DN5053_c0_g1_i2.p1  ORF type:complete len:966 (-),score=325.96 TRINITY_DN5053_c0_g1_i2:59-2956(-)